MKKALVFLADGFEEMEAVTPLDFMRRAGLDAKFVSLAGTLSVTGSHGVTYRADMLFDEKVASEADMLILPGGLPGAQNLQDNEALGKLLLKFHEEGKFVCAICDIWAFCRAKKPPFIPAWKTASSVQHPLLTKYAATAMSSLAKVPAQP